MPSLRIHPWRSRQLVIALSGVLLASALFRYLPSSGRLTGVRGISLASFLGYNTAANSTSPAAFDMSWSTDIPALRAQWRKTIAELPSTPNNIPAIFLAHGQPMIIWPKSLPPPSGGPLGQLYSWGGADGPLAQFLDDFGPVLLEKYKPKGIVVFSAHWETDGERLVSDYGDENPLLFDYGGFDPELYRVQFKSRGDKALSQRVVEAFKKAGMSARTTPPTEGRGWDGRPLSSPGVPPPLPGTVLGAGLDHGVFVPFIRMFGSSMPRTVPIVEASIDESLSPEQHFAIGEAMGELRKEGYLVVAGGLTVHTRMDGMSGFSVHTAKEALKVWDRQVAEAVAVSDPEERKKALFALTRHPGFRQAHQREEHFIPLYVAAGAGSEGGSKVLSEIYGQSSYAFGL